MDTQSKFQKICGTCFGVGCFECSHRGWVLSNESKSDDLAVMVVLLWVIFIYHSDKIVGMDITTLSEQPNIEEAFNNVRSGMGIPEAAYGAFDHE